MEPPNGGWGWLVALAVFLESGLIFGVIRSFRVFFMEFVGHFGELAGRVFWVTSITIAILLFASEYRLSGLLPPRFNQSVSSLTWRGGCCSPTGPTGIPLLPLAGPVGTALSTQYGTRPMVMAGGVLSGLGMLLASFATSLTYLYLNIGLLSGRLCGMLVFAPSVAMLARYFKRCRALATAVAFSAPGLSSLAFSPLFQFLVDSYGWRGGLMIVAGLTFHLVACGALLCPLALAENLALAPAPQRSWLAKLSSLFGLALLTSRPFLTFAVAGLLMNLGYLVPFAHLVPHACEIGFDEYQAACLVSVMGATNPGGRLVAGWLDARRTFRLLHTLTLWTLLMGITLLLVPFRHICLILMGIDICYGFLAGVIIPLKFSSLVEIVGTGRISEATGLVNLMESFGALAGPPLSGFLRDMTRSYTVSFIASGTFLMAGGLVFFMVPNFCSCSTASPPKQSGDPEDAGNLTHQNGDHPCTREPRALTSGNGPGQVSPLKSGQ
ncbi:monocarboxylate transporter 13-like [Dermochelys coriacea]|uniref:monocarboxylate transporter 13-like n=1 Tax=Dermochelys coriacea TaxID=27794 RepID=UPI001CA7CB16|nr:monocarboxylate transporter 13-like [Dermochelys coriacea]